MPSPRPEPAPPSGAPLAAPVSDGVLTGLVAAEQIAQRGLRRRSGGGRGAHATRTNAPGRPWPVPVRTTGCGCRLRRRAGEDLLAGARRHGVGAGGVVATAAGRGAVGTRGRVRTLGGCGCLAPTDTRRLEAGCGLRGGRRGRRGGSARLARPEPEPERRRRTTRRRSRRSDALPRPSSCRAWTGPASVAVKPPPGDVVTPCGGAPATGDGQFCAAREVRAVDRDRAARLVGRLVQRDVRLRVAGIRDSSGNDERRHEHCYEGDAAPSHHVRAPRLAGHGTLLSRKTRTDRSVDDDRRRTYSTVSRTSSAWVASLGYGKRLVPFAWGGPNVRQGLRERASCGRGRSPRASRRARSSGQETSVSPGRETSLATTQDVDAGEATREQRALQRRRVARRRRRRSHRPADPRRARRRRRRAAAGRAPRARAPAPRRSRRAR